MHFLKKILLGQEISESIHHRFTRYSRGTFEGPFIQIKNSGKELKVSGCYEYMGILGEMILNHAQGRFSFNGKIVSREDKKALLEKFLQKEKKRGSLFIYEVMGEASKEELLKIYQEAEDEKVILNLSSLEDKKKWKLNGKKNLPSPGKVDNKFFTGTLGLEALASLKEELLWDSDKEGFKEADISHKYTIDELIIPEEYKNNFTEARLRAKRKGKVKRVLVVDGQREEKESGLLV